MGNCQPSRNEWARVSPRRREHGRIGVCVTLVAVTFAWVADAAEPLQQAYLQQHCIACHAGDAPESGLDLTTLSTHLEDAEVHRRWVDLYDRVAAGTMPPASETAPEADETRRFLESLGGELSRAETAHREVLLRRLNRDEYIHTVRDLFGIEVDLSTTLPDDTVEQGFDTTASGLSLSPDQMLLYLEAADLVLDEVFGPEKAPPQIRETLNIRDLRSSDTADRIDDDGVVLFSGAKSLPMYGFAVRGPAAYRLTIHAKAIQTEEPVVMQVEGGVTGRIPGHTAGFFEIPPGEVTTIELIDRAVESSDTFAFRLHNGFPWWSVDTATYQGAGLWLGDITIEGPLEPWPRPSRQALLGDVDPSHGSLDDIKQILLRHLPRAFRRPADRVSPRPYLDLAKRSLDAGESFEAALRHAIKGVLCAAEFLFLEEPLATPREPGHESGRPRTAMVDDVALASRLSYFLWRSLPDEELLSLAASNTLHHAEVLTQQVERMLDDEKSQRFVVSFTDQWLRLRDIDFTVPNDQLYPEYSQLLRQSMLDETRAFFREILQSNLSVQTFLDSDFAMLNRPLAEFYGIDGVEGLAMQRVPLPADSPRGGVLTQASVLKVSADGTRTSPVLRGAWILKHLYGTPSPPPPPSVTAIEPDIRGATTIREQLARHRDHASCASCHKAIDPPGFALECFDVIGGQRDWYRVANGGEHVPTPLHPESPNHHVRYQRGPAVDTTGQTPDGQSFENVRDYKQWLVDDDAAFTRALTRLLLSYAIGRRLGFADRAEVDRIADSTADDHHGLRSIVHAVVASPMFRQP